MKRKVKIIISVCALVVLFGVGGYLLIGNPVVFLNNWKLEKAVTSIQEETVLLNEVVPFQWDQLYTFGPYESRESIEKAIGFQSRDIKVNHISEGMVQLLFVKNQKVVASVLGYASNLHYRISFSAKENMMITYQENAQFMVEKSDEVTSLTYMK